MSLKDTRNSSNRQQKTERANTNKQKTNPMFVISLISGIIVVTALSSSVITALILKQDTPFSHNNSTTSPRPVVAESPNTLPNPAVAESPTASLSPTVSESPTTSPSETGVSLLDLECLSSTPGVEQPLVKQSEPKNIAIGGEVLPEIAYLYNQRGEPYPYISVNQPAGVSCNLKSKFRQLNLIIGINSKHEGARNQKSILLEISLDNKSAIKRNVTVASKQNLNINVQNAKSIGIKAICPENIYNYSCPYLAFVEASLR